MINLSEKQKKELLALTPKQFKERQDRNKEAGKITPEQHSWILGWYLANRPQPTTDLLDLVIKTFDGKVI